MVNELDTMSYWLPLGNNLLVGTFLVLTATWLGMRGQATRIQHRLAVYLLLVGSGLILDAWARLPLHAVTTPSALLLAQKVLGALDVAAFFLFSHELARGPPRGWRPSAVVGAAILQALALLVTGTSTIFLAGDGIRMAHVVVHVLGYGWGFAMIAQAYVHAPAGSGRDRLGFYFLAFGVVVLPRLSLLHSDLYGFGLEDGLGWPPFAVLCALLATTAAYVLSRSGAVSRHEVRNRLVTMAALTAVILLVWVARFVPGFADAARTQVYTIRWLLFGFVFTWGMHAHDIVAGRRLTHRAGWVASLCLLALAGTNLGASVLVGGEGFSVAGAYIASAVPTALAVVVPSLVASRTPGAEPGREYAAAVYGAYVQARAGMEELARLREELGLSWADAKRIERVAPPGTDPQATLEPGARLGRYDVLAAIGSGSTGTVHLAWDRARGRHVALKEMEGCAAPRAREFLKAQVDAMRRLRSPHVARLHGFTLHGANPVIVMEHIQGRTLREHTRERPLAAVEALPLLRDCIAALRAIHAAGVVHGDVKPENIVISLDRGAVLVDIGWPRGPDSHATHGAGGTARHRTAGGRAGHGGASDDVDGLCSSFLETLEETGQGALLGRVLRQATARDVDDPPPSLDRLEEAVAAFTVAMRRPARG